MGTPPCSSAIFPRERTFCDFLHWKKWVFSFLGLISKRMAKWTGRVAPLESVHISRILDLTRLWPWRTAKMLLYVWGRSIRIPWKIIAELFRKICFNKCWETLMTDQKQPSCFIFFTVVMFECIIRCVIKICLKALTEHAWPTSEHVHSDHFIQVKFAL